MSNKKSVEYILFTHNDLDGAGCRVIFSLAHNDMNRSLWKVVNCSNTDVDDKVQQVLDEEILNDHATICFGDICCSRELFLKLRDMYAPRLFVWDHHRTNFWVQTEYPSATIVPENEIGQLQSGTNLMYQYYSQRAADLPPQRWDELKIFQEDYCTAEQLAKFVDTIRSYDTFEWKDTDNRDAKKLQVLFMLLGMERFCKRYIDRLNGEISCEKELFDDRDLEFIMAKIDAEQERINAFTEDDIIECTVFGYRTAFALSTIGMNVSELSYQFLRRYPKYDIFASFSFANGGEFSFRTAKDDLSCGEDIAAKIGGGGHPKAAGAPICDQLRDTLIEHLIAEMNGEFIE